MGSVYLLSSDRETLITKAFVGDVLTLRYRQLEAAVYQSRSNPWIETNIAHRLPAGLPGSNGTAGISTRSKGCSCCTRRT